MKTTAWILNKRPNGEIDDDTLRLEERELRALTDGEVLVKNTHFSIDPTNRGWMNAQDTYLPAVQLGDVMRAITAGHVVASKSPKFSEGDAVVGLSGFASHAVCAASALTRLPAGVKPQSALGVFGHIGMTAYFGLNDIGQLKDGEAVLVSGAAGATGSLVSQLAKSRGCTVVGTAGSDDKCRYLTEELGLDAAINYKEHDSSMTLARALAPHFPNGIDVFFDNVGGDILDAALARIALRGRIVLCGGISQYNAVSAWGPKNYLALIVKRARMEGFVITDYSARASESVAAYSTLLADGKIKFRVHSLQGIEAVPDGLARLFSGNHQGKLIVEI